MWPCPDGFARIIRLHSARYAVVRVVGDRVTLGISGQGRKLDVDRQSLSWMSDLGYPVFCDPDSARRFLLIYINASMIPHSILVKDASFRPVDAPGQMIEQLTRHGFYIAEIRAVRLYQPGVSFPHWKPRFFRTRFRLKVVMGLIRARYRVAHGFRIVRLVERYTRSRSAMAWLIAHRMRPV